MSNDKRLQFCFGATAMMVREFEELAAARPHYARGLIHRLIWSAGLAVIRRRFEREKLDIDAEIERLFAAVDGAERTRER